jgi:hypothetical protein
MLKVAMPYAVRNTLNGLAFSARKDWQRGADQKFILRNHFTHKSIRVDQVYERQRIGNMFSTTGSVASYMQDQERGSVREKKGKTGYPIAGTEASGESSLPRKRDVRKLNRRKNIALASQLKMRHVPREQRIAATIRKATEQPAGKRFAFLAMGTKRGIYKIKGGKRNPVVRKVWDLSKPSVKTVPAPTMTPAALAAKRKGLALYTKSIKWQIARLKR